MDWQDQAKATRDTKFSSCRGVSFELKPSPGTSFTFEAADRPVHQPPPDAPMAKRWISFAGPFGSASSRIFAAARGSHSFGRSQSRPSSHFCDLDDEETDDEPVSAVEGADEELGVVTAAGVADDKPGKAAAGAPAQARQAPPARSRLGVILLEQGLFTVYKRLFVLCIALTAVGLALAATGHFPYAREHAAVFAMGNILALTLCRSEAVLRVVFWLAVALFGRPWVPVVVKTGVTAILQSLGGVHSGCGVSSLAWLAYALVQALQHRDVTPREIVGVEGGILGLLALSCMAAFPLVRHLHHNVFERTHRFACWSAIALLWVFVVLSAGYDPDTASYDRLTGAIIVKRQELWLAAAITFFTFLPWLTVRRVPVTVTARSSHASVITFQGGVKGGLVGRISRSQLSEWHAFGIISDNGDTHAMLAGAVAGPAELSLVWVAKGIEANYGEEMKAAAYSSERLRGRVIVHDTAVMGRPNVAALAVDAARRWGSEVVVVTSNPEGSRDVVTGCHKAGIPAFVPIWDS
ncbi:uncharacterized protein C2845_PM07G15650 [Panicum miliaceum]|uniref:Uncharacterized protein n=1 Tax=Panicum miliaceum TaxID=4540 RepID=A0A3L6SHV8_PANMI|nr:uncharacterized protein C2845_PM07G15650 [Panicum miliaceum]